MRLARGEMRNRDKAFLQSEGGKMGIAGQCPDKACEFVMNQETAAALLWCQLARACGTGG